METVRDVIPIRRGLRKFINDIRQCNSKETETERVQTELLNIRSKFGSNKSLKSYDKKKYAWKLVYIFMLGYDVEFGHMEIVKLASSQNKAEKIVGYTALGVLLVNDDELTRLVVNTIREDLQSDDEFSQCLALNFVANLGGKELCDLASDVLRIVRSHETPAMVRKKAFLSVLSLCRTNPDIVASEDIVAPLVGALEQSFELGLCLSAIELATFLATTKDRDPYKQLLPVVVTLLERIVVQGAISSSYEYHQVPCPILQVRLFQYLQLFELPPNVDTLLAVLRSIFGKNEVVRSVYKSNAMHSILVEAVNLVIEYGETIPDTKLLNSTVDILGRFIMVRDANIRYLGLTSLTRLAQTAQRDGLDQVMTALGELQITIQRGLDDADKSIRRAALDLLFSVCEKSNANEIIPKLLQYLKTVSYDMKSDTVLKIAILAERYAGDYKNYVDTILHLISMAGDYVSDDIWHRVIQIVTNNTNLHSYAAQEMFTALQTPHVHETTVKVGAYILGEFGYKLVEELETATPGILYDTMDQHFAVVSNDTRCILFHAYLKLAHLYPGDLREDVVLLLDAFRDSSDLELQQRASEYFQLASAINPVITKTVLQPMPLFKEQQKDYVTTKLARTPEDEEQQPSVDLIGVDQDYTLEHEPHISMSATPQERHLHKLLLEPKGLIYEDHLIQIGIQHQYQGEKGKMMLFYGNKTHGPLNNFLVTMLDMMPNLHTQLSEIESTIEPRAQARQTLLSTCMIPFDSLPVLQLSFTHNGTDVHFVQVDLPIGLTSFASPVEFSVEEFQKRWSTIQSEEMFIIGQLTHDQVVERLKALHFGITIDKQNNNSIIAACTVKTGTVNPKTQQPAVIGCIAYIAGSTVTIRCVNPVATTGIKLILLKSLK